MPFQSSVLPRIGAGLPGELAFEDGGLRATPAMLASEDVANNVFGRVFTITEVPDESIHEGLRVQAGGDGVIVGILANPKEHVMAEAEGFGPSLQLGNGVIAGFVSCGYVFVQLTNAGSPGDAIAFDTATGEVSAVPQGDDAPAGSRLLPSAIVYRYNASITAPYDGLAVVRVTDPNLPLPAATPEG